MSSNLNNTTKSCCGCGEKCESSKCSCTHAKAESTSEDTEEDSDIKLSSFLILVIGLFSSFINISAAPIIHPIAGSKKGFTEFTGVCRTAQDDQCRILNKNIGDSCRCCNTGWHGKCQFNYNTQQKQCRCNQPRQEGPGQIAKN